MDNNTIYNVKNRSAGMLLYTIPEDGIRREFAPGETKKIKFDELEKLSYQSGGKELMSEYMQIQSAEVLDELNINVEPEYHYSEEDIIKIMQTGSQDEWLDMLDFAPDGVMELIRSLSVSVPLTNLNKIESLKKKTGFDVSKALANIRAEKEDENTEKEEAPARRVKPATIEGRRTTPKYNVVSKSDK